MTKQITAVFKRDGGMAVETSGFSGETCMATMQSIAEAANALGLNVKAKQITPKNDQPEETVSDTENVNA